jgi:hypothetical protein
MNGRLARVARATAVAVLVGATTASMARAEESASIAPSEAPPPQMVVVDGEEITAPAVGAPKEAIQEYFKKIAERQRAVALRLRESEDPEEIARLRARKASLRELNRAEENRLMDRNVPLAVVGGIVLAGAAASMITAVVFSSICFMFCEEEDAAPRIVGPFIGGVVGLGAGIPMLVVGVHRTPRQPQARSSWPAVRVRVHASDRREPPMGSPPKRDLTGGEVALTWSF